MIDLRKGDCLEVMKNIPDKSIDMILCDLPYGTTACKWDTIIPFEPLWEQYNRIIKENGAIVLFGSEPFSSKLRISNLKNYKYDWVWNKKSASNSLMANKRPLKEYENIIVFCKSQTTYNPQKEERIKAWTRAGKGKNKTSNIYGTKVDLYIKKEDDKLSFPKSILTFSLERTEASRSKRVHPTQKPVELLEYLIKTYTNENETVLDNCMGSGSTGVACINTNRNFIGIELDDKYFEIAKKRIEDVSNRNK